MEMGMDRLRPRPLRLIHTDKGRVKEVADDVDRLRPEHKSFIKPPEVAGCGDPEIERLGSRSMLLRSCSESLICGPISRPMQAVFL
jgi:hypothetical protein